MSHTDEPRSRCRCSGTRERQSNAILYNILSRQEDCEPTPPERPGCSSPPNSCHCETPRTVCLRTPDETCQGASAVLVKTIRFMRSLPSFQQLPPCDQLALLRACWTPVFILGLAQDGLDFQVSETPACGLLKSILLNGPEPHSATAPPTGRAQPTLPAVHKLKACLHKFWSLDLTPKEYAYLKGAMLFNPDVPHLKAALFIEGLQQEAQHALQEVVLPLHPHDHGRFARILLTASTLKTINPSLVTELFFRPIIGPANLLELLAEMLFMR
ncbi:hypothetical protein JZ751_015460 [Albula glossodonta]|uniref:NR LBD domain-containing protein n=1 Tax=Albula glossodonta TaxID=121402 RepID=A0A8T2N1I1_9TELE|nr:hypothetical protein JZ751_015460 [Albula glossodonta]